MKHNYQKNERTHCIHTIRFVISIFKPTHFIYKAQLQEQYLRVLILNMVHQMRHQCLTLHEVTKQNVLLKSIHPLYRILIKNRNLKKHF